MQAFTTLESKAIPITIGNLDTDQLCPEPFLRKARNDGMGQYLFYRLRFDETGAPRPDFPLNDPERAGAEIIVGATNFGCGSSREHAVWALADYGIRAVIADGFGEIFRANCLKNGLLPIVLPPETVTVLRDRVIHDVTARVFVDLSAQEVRGPDGDRNNFEIDRFRKKLLVDGHDPIDFTLQYSTEIAAFSERGQVSLPVQSDGSRRQD